MKKKNCLLAFALLLGISLAVLSLGCVESAPAPTKEQLACAHDSDCVLVKAVCGCDCFTALNKNFTQEWENARNESASACASVQCAPCPPQEFYDTQCVSNACIIFKKPANASPQPSEEIPPFPPDEFPTPSPTTTPSMVACTQEAKMCPDGSYVGRVAPNCDFAPCPSATPEITSESVIQVSLHLWSSGICGDRGPNGEVRAAERDYAAFNNGTFFFKYSCEANSTTKTVSHAELESLAGKVLALNTPELIAENASGPMCVGGSGTLYLLLDGKTLEFRDACGRSDAYRNAYDAAVNQLMSYAS